MEEAVRTAITGHPSVLAGGAGARAAEQDAEAAFSAFLPQVTVDAGVTYERSNTPATRRRNGPNQTAGEWATDIPYTYGITVNQLLYDFNRTQGVFDAATERAESQRFTAAAASEAVALRAATAYLEVLRNRELLAMAQRSVDIHEDFIERAQLAAETGAGTETDLVQIRLRLNLAVNQVIDFESALRTASASYIEAIGEMPGELERPGGPTEFDGLHVDELVLLAFETNPQLRGAESDIRASRSDLSAAVPGYFPTLSLELNAMQMQGDDSPNEGDFETSLTATVNMNMSLYQGGADVAARQRALELVGEAVQRDAEARRLIEQQVRTAHAQYVAAIDSQPVLTDTLNANRQLLTDYQAQFENGERGLLEILDAENLLIAAEIDFSNNAYDLLVAQYGILGAMGQLQEFVGSSWTPVAE